MYIYTYIFGIILSSIFLFFEPVSHCFNYCSFKIYIYIYIYFFFNKFIYSFLAVLGLPCCTRAFSSCSKQELLFVALHGLLIAVASLVLEHGL